MKTLTINGITFQVITPRKQEIKDSYTAQFNSQRTTRKTLHQAYQKPSHIKCTIYNEWYAWYSETKQLFDNNFTDNNAIYAFGITSYNSMQFTISFKLEYNCIDYLGIITKAHNKLIKIN